MGNDIKEMVINCVTGISQEVEASKETLAMIQKLRESSEQIQEQISLEDRIFAIEEMLISLMGMLGGG